MAIYKPPEHFPSASSSPVWRVPKFGLCWAGAPFPALFQCSIPHIVPNIFLGTFHSIALPRSGCWDQTAQSPQGMGVPRFSMESSFPVPALQCSLFPWLFGRCCPWGYQNALATDCGTSALQRLSNECHVNLSLMLSASFISHSWSLAVFTSSSHFLCHVLLGFPICNRLLKVLIESYKVGWRFMPCFSIYVRHFTLASRTVFLSLMDVCRLLGLELLI